MKFRRKKPHKDFSQRLVLKKDCFFSGVHTGSASVVVSSHSYAFFPSLLCNISNVTSHINVAELITSEGLLFNTKRTIFQLYHGENKLHFIKMMMLALYYTCTNTISWNVILIAH